MPKAIIEFNLPEENDDYELAVNASKMYCILWDLRQNVFRPARKHGYSNPVIQAMISRINECCQSTEVTAEDLIYELELMFNELLAEHGYKGDI